MSALAGPIIDAIEGALTNADSAGSGREAQQVFNAQVSDVLGEISEGVLWVFGQVYGAWQWSLDHGKQIGKDFEQIQGANQSAILHLAENVLPDSLGYLNGYIFSTGIVPLRQAVDKINSQIRFLMGWRGQIDNWRNNWVDPNIATVRSFITAFNTNDRPAINTLRGWLSKPGTFGTWAAPFIIKPFVGDITGDEFSGARLALALAMVRTWSDEVNPVWDAVLQWVVSSK